MTINDPNWLAAYKSLALPEDANDADHVAADRDGRVYLYPVALSVVGGYWRQGLCQTGDVTPSSDWEGSLCTVGAIRAYEPPKQVRLRVDMQTGEVRYHSSYSDDPRDKLVVGIYYSYLDGHDTPEGHAEARRTVAAWLRERANKLENSDD